MHSGSLQLPRRLSCPLLPSRSPLRLAPPDRPPGSIGRPGRRSGTGAPAGKQVGPVGWSFGRSTCRPPGRRATWQIHRSADSTAACLPYPTSCLPSRLLAPPTESTDQLPAYQLPACLPACLLALPTESTYQLPAYSAQHRTALSAQPAAQPLRIEAQSLQFMTATRFPLAHRSARG